MPATITPPYTRDSAEFARWLNGDLTNACGHDLHEICKGTISTIGIECECLCRCHLEPTDDR